MSLNAASFQKDLTYESTAAAKAVLGDLGQIRAIDEETEKQQKKWGTISLLSVLGGGLGALAFMAASQGAAAAVVAVLTLILSAFALITWSRHRRCNIENRRYLLATQLLELLKVDFAPDQPVTAKLDFRPVTDKSKFERKGTAGTWKVRFFNDPWLKLSGRFADGTSFDLVHTELHQARSKVKTSRSGKLKHKTKTKSAFEAELRLRFKPAKYAHMATLKADAEQAIQMPEGIEVKRLRYSDKEIGLRIVGKGSWGVMQRRESMLGSGFDATRVHSLMFLSLFQILNLSKAIQKSAASGESA